MYSGEANAREKAAKSEAAKSEAINRVRELNRMRANKPS